MDQVDGVGTGMVALMVQALVAVVALFPVVVGISGGIDGSGFGGCGGIGFSGGGDFRCRWLRHLWLWVHWFGQTWGLIGLDGLTGLSVC